MPGGVVAWASAPEVLARNSLLRAADYISKGIFMIDWMCCARGQKLHAWNRRAIVQVTPEPFAFLKSGLDAALTLKSVSALSSGANFLPMRLKLYCNRFAHFKDALVCSVSCPYRTRCQDFALFYDANRRDVDSLVEDYFAQRTATAPQRPLALASTHVEMRELIRLEVKREMAEALYIWIGKDDQAELLEHEEIIRRAERGSKAKNIYKVSQEMELRYQLVPRKRIEKAKRVVAAQEERAAARRTSRRPRPVAIEPPAPLAPVVPVNTSTTQPRRTRARIAKAVGER